MRSVAAIPALGLLAGSALGLAVPGLPNALLVAVLIAGSGAACSGWRLRRQALVVAGTVLTFAAGGAMLAQSAWREAWRPTLRTAFESLASQARTEAAAEGRLVPEDDEAFAIVSGVLRADAGPGANGVSISLDVDRIERRPGASMPVAGGVVATVVGSLAPGRMAEWRAGRQVRVPVQLHRPSRYLDVGVPDGERALARRGTTLVGTVKSGALVEVTARGSRWDEALGAVRGYARRAIHAAVGRWSARSAAIVAAIVIGDRSGLDPDVQRQLQDAGTFHVIAISGSNIAIFAALMLGAFRLAGLLGRAATLSATAVLLAYAALVGGGASVDRATLMAVVYLGGRALDQRSPPVNTLWVAVATLVASAPLSVADPAFALTVGATFGILVVAPAAARLTRAWPRPLQGLASVLAASLAAEAVLFPVGALVFSRVTFAGLGLNLLAVPLMAVAEIAGMAVVPLALASSALAAAAGWVAAVGAAGLVWSAGLVRFVPAVTSRVAPPSWPALTAYYVAALVAWTWWGRPAARAVALAAAGLAAVWIVAEPWAWAAGRGDDRLHVTFLDVGQGDSALIRFPHGRAMLVDTGGLAFGSGFDIGDRVVAPVLRNAGIRRLDYLALTHGDPDHIGGARSVLTEFRPREVWEGIPVPRFEPLTRLRLQAQAAGLRWANVYAGDHLRVDGVDVVAEHPGPADWERPKVRNDDSLVLELRWREVSVLLTGDIGTAVERTLPRPAAGSRLRVVKVPHHGSLTSSGAAWIRAWHPTVAVMSVGRDNHFGHPAPAVVQRYRDAGAAIFRTDEDGAVMVDTDGSELDVHTFTGRTLRLPGRREDAKDTRH